MSNKNKFLEGKDLVAEFKELHAMYAEKYETVYSTTKDQFVVYKGKGQSVTDIKLLGNGTIRVGQRTLHKGQGNNNTQTAYLRLSGDNGHLYLNLKTKKFLKKRLTAVKPAELDQQAVLDYIKKNMTTEDLLKAIVGK